VTKLKIVLNDFVEIERTTWKAILCSDGSMKRVSDLSRLIIAREKARLTGYNSDRIVCSAVESTRVNELLQRIECVKKEEIQ